MSDTDKRTWCHNTNKYKYDLENKVALCSIEKTAIADEFCTLNITYMT